MAKLSRLLLLLSVQCLIGLSWCQDWDKLATFVLNTFNDKSDSVYLYRSAKVINGYPQNDSRSAYYLKLDFSVGCNSELISEADCFPKNLICEVIVTYDSATDLWNLKDDETKCNLPVPKESSISEPQNVNQDPSSFKQQQEDAKQIFDYLGPFLLTHLSPLPKEKLSSSHDEQEPIDKYQDPINKEQDSINEEDDTSKDQDSKNNEQDPIIDQQETIVKDLEPINEEKEEVHEEQDPINVEKEQINEETEQVNGEKEEVNREKEEVNEEKEEVNEEQDPINEEIEQVNDDRAPISEDRMTVLNEPTVDSPLVEVDEPVFVKKQAYCTGCVTDIDVNIPGLQELTEQALVMIDEFSNNLYKHNIVKIAKAQKQVVSGIKYILSLEISETDCLKSSSQERDACEPNSVNSRTCVVEYLDKPWLKSRTVIGNNCTTHQEDENNSLENEIVPDFANKPESDRAAIFDYLDAMDQPMNDMETETEFDPSSLDSRDEVEKDETNESRESDDNSGESERKVNPKYAMLNADGGVFRKKREVRGGNRSGALKDISVTEKKLVHDLAELAVATLDEIDADDSRRVVLDILDAKKQLVDSAVMYSLKLRVGSTSCNENGEFKDGCLDDQVAAPKICIIQMHRSFAADSPNNVKVVKSECTNEPRGRNRRADDVRVGGYRPANVTDPYIQDMASFAALELDKTSNSLFKHSVVRVVKAEQQVVSGMKIRLTIELGESSCRKDGVAAGPCQLADEIAPRKLCDVTIWDQPWLKNRRVTDSSCYNADEAPSRTKRSSPKQFVGGPTEIDVSDPTVHRMAKVALDHISGLSNSIYTQDIVKVNHATKQLVAGVKYTLSFEIGYTSCRKGGKKSVAACQVKKHSNNQICRVVLWERAWLNETKVMEASCLPAPGGSTTHNNVKRAAKVGGGSHDIHYGMFRDFMARHNKAYATQEETKRRFHIYRANMKKVLTLQQTEQGTAKYGDTQFADLTSKEFKKHYLGLKPELKTEHVADLPHAKIPQIALPPEYDWRDYNIVTPVKNQGMCGSCWAFSVTGNVEGQWALRRGQLLSLSEQELVDCDKVDSGCEGGLPSNAYNAITELGGLETETDYPYDGADEKCHFNKTEVKVTVTGGLNITTNETAMAQWLVKKGPISIGINANAMQFYMGGVSHPWKMLCDPNNLDHGVLIVGYGVHDYPLFKKTLPFWIVKNSWGDKWGEQGYYRVYRGDGTCGVNQMATSAIVG